MLDLALMLIVGPKERACICEHGGALGAVVSAIQYRDKSLQPVPPELIPSPVLLVNDDVEGARALGEGRVSKTWGVHVGQEDATPAEARRVLGADALVGLTVKTPADLDRTGVERVDYLSIGGVFPSASKPLAGAPLGVAGLAAMVEQVRLRFPQTPCLAISGITRDTLGAVLATGVDGVAVITAITGAADPVRAARELRQHMRESRP